MMIDVSKIRVGDEGTVRVRFVDIRNGSFRVETLRFGGSMWAFASDLSTHTPKPREFKPGDRVTWGNGSRTYEFLAQRGGTAFLWSNAYGAALPNISELRHADESE
jgi:hypothetical protein